MHIANDTTGSLATDGADIGFFTGQTALQILNRENDSVIISTNDLPRLTIDGSGNSTFAGDVILGDSSQIQLGTGNDAQIDHNGSHLFIDNSVGNTYLRNTSTGDILLRNSTGGDIQFDNEFAGNILFNTSNVTRLTINSSGNSTFAGNVLAPIFNVDTTSLSIISESNRMKFTNAIANDAGGYDFFTRNSSSTYINALTILGSGNVGIGTDSPSKKLHVVSTAEAALFQGSATWGTAIQINATATGGRIFQLQSTANSEGSGGGNFLIVDKGTTAAPTALNRLIIDSSGNVTVSDGGLFLNKSDGAYISIKHNNSLKGYLGIANQVITGGSTGDIGLTATNNLVLGSGGTTERMRITSGGDTVIGGGALLAQGSLSIAPLGDDGAAVMYFNRANTSADSQCIQFMNDGSIKGGITYNSTSATFNTSSDYRLKEDLQDFAGLDMVSKIPVYDFKWKADESRSYGVMAHELQDVLPQAVTGKKDAEDMQQVDYSKIVPLLVKSIQELKAEVDKLKQECKCK